MLPNVQNVTVLNVVQKTSNKSTLFNERTVGKISSVKQFFFFRSTMFEEGNKGKSKI